MPLMNNGVRVLLTTLIAFIITPVQPEPQNSPVRLDQRIFSSPIALPNGDWPPKEIQNP